MNRVSVTSQQRRGRRLLRGGTTFLWRSFFFGPSGERKVIKQHCRLVKKERKKEREREIWPRCWPVWVRRLDLANMKTQNLFHHHRKETNIDRIPAFLLRETTKAETSPNHIPTPVAWTWILRHQEICCWVDESLKSKQYESRPLQALMASSDSVDCFLFFFQGCCRKQGQGLQLAKHWQQQC